MGPDARALLPFDLPALIAHGSRSRYENQAWTRERVGSNEAQPTLNVLRDQLLTFGKQRKTWVSLRRQKLHALVGIRERGGHRAWEIDYLVDCLGDETAILRLLSLAVQSAGESRAEKLFLRMDAESALLPATHATGFVPYQEETLYVRDSRPAEPPAAPSDVRPATAADSYNLFRLYTAATPESARRLEAATYGEWQASQERRWLRNGVQLVRGGKGRLDAAVSASRVAHGVLLDMTLITEAIDQAPGLIEAAVRDLDDAPSDARLLTLAPATNDALARRLEEAGFVARGNFVSLVHRTTRPLALPKGLPAVAENAVGV